MAVLKKLKRKPCAGYDKIPMLVIKDSKYIIQGALQRIFNTINEQKCFPGVWKIAKIKPLHKKGKKEDITNYRPISNLNSISKIYELCMLNYIKKLQKKWNKTNRRSSLWV